MLHRVIGPHRDITLTPHPPTGVLPPGDMRLESPEQPPRLAAAESDEALEEGAEHQGALEAVPKGLGGRLTDKHTPRSRQLGRATRGPKSDLVHR